ncbi:MAG: hypothetical protein K8S27_13395 [Candidatus Omnitrophica bacterium]|nr:hypothetical protein [Candidatus Omnitrophota bacterium]
MKTKNFIFIFLFMVLSVSVCSCAKKITNMDSDGERIICFGDSLTLGIGVNRENTYPAYLTGMLRKNIEVVNSGVNGDTSADALERLFQDVLSQEPRLVVIFLGTNDFYQGVPYDQTHKHISEMIDKIHDFGAMVCIVSFNNRKMRNKYLEGYYNLSEAYNTLLVPDVMENIWGHPLNKVDWLHPDERGNEMIAERIYDVIKKYLK